MELVSPSLMPGSAYERCCSDMLRILFVLWALMGIVVAISAEVSVAPAQSMPIEGTISIPDGVTVPANFRVHLDGDKYSAMTNVAGAFKFYDVPSGIYLLDVASVNHLFPQIKVKVSAQNGTINVVEYKYPGAKRVPAPYPIVLAAIIPLSYFQVRQKFSILGMIMGNPMMLMMLVSLCVVMYFPKMMSGMDPEAMKELQKEAEMSGDPMSKLLGAMGMGSKPADDDE